VAIETARLAALIPCHDEPPAVELLRGVADQVAELLIVDDGSPPARASELARRADEVGATLLRLPANHGKGHALAAGLRYLRAQEPAPHTVVVLDGDGQHPPDAIARLRATDAELVIGDRLDDPAMPLWRKLPNRFVSALLAALTHTSVRDSQCGMRVLRGRALSDIAFPGGRFESETRYLKRCLLAGVRVAWVPIPAVYENHASSFRPLRDSLLVLRALLD
jgi:glycosyltransferase involved in cell wall biosynthesis